MARIVSLLPSTTEIACALGLGDQLVGRSHECDFPAHVRDLPVCTEAKIDAGQPGAAIDRDVKQLVRDGLSVYRVDADRLRSLEPDLILTQSQCEVCAVTPKDLEGAVSDWIGNAPQVVSLEPNRLQDIWDDFGRVALAAGLEDRGAAIVQGLTLCVTSIAEQSMREKRRPRVACIDWIDPLMAGGNWIPELVTLAGGKCLFGRAGEHAPWLEPEALWQADPDCIFVFPCGFDLDRTRAEMAPLCERPEWSDLRAVKDAKVFLADGNAYFNRPGPRMVDSLEILAEALHPDLFRFGHEGRGWERWRPR